MTEKKLVNLSAVIIAFAFVIELQMIKIVCSDYYLQAENQDIKTINISTGRADIVDCNLNQITGTENQVVALITRETDIEDIARNIRPEDVDKFYERLQNESRVVVNLEKSINSDTIFTTSKRYSDFNIAQNLIGYTDYENKGVSGIEKAFEEKLNGSGRNITLKFNVNGNGEIYGDVESIPDKNIDVLSLTIDNSIQRMCESVAREHITNGSILVMECKTGKIKAMVSVPTYNPNDITPYLNMDNSPFLNKALQSYEPGSVIKPLWAAVLIENGYNSDSVYECKGYTVVNDHIYHCANNVPHGEVDMQKALTVSCNCYFIDSFIKNKGYIFKQYANQIHLGNAIKLCDNYYTSDGNFPDIYSVDNLGIQSSICFGQGGFTASPVHIASYFNIFANGGKYVYPQIVQGIYDMNTKTIKENLYQKIEKQIISRETAEKVKNMLINVVEEGAHSRAKPEHLTAAGKTGTAQTGKRNPDGSEIFTAWFCGIYPTEEPEYVICITMYDGGESSVTTTPIFKMICDNLYYLKYNIKIK